MYQFSSVQSLSRVRLPVTPMNRSMPGLPVHHKLPEFTQTHAHRVSDAIQPSHPLSSTSLPAPNPSQSLLKLMPIESVMPSSHLILCHPLLFLPPIPPSIRVFSNLTSESEKVSLTLNIQKSKIMASGPITSWEIDGETVETVSDFIFLGSKIAADGDCSHEIKRRSLPWKKGCMYTYG